jgi:hypothetical protein
MFNDPELSGKYLGTITSDFVKVADYLKEASFQIRSRALSDFPIFPISKETIAIGTLLYEADRFQNTWFYYASMEEEFIQRGMIDADKLEEFRASYRDPDEYCCLFVVDQQFIHFVYIPYPEE